MESAPDPLPFEIDRAAQRGELQKVVKWLRKGGLVDAFYSARTVGGRPSSFALLHTAAASNHLDMLKMLLEQGASVDLPSSFGVTAARHGCLSIVLVLLQHSAKIPTCTTSKATPP